MAEYLVGILVEQVAKESELFAGKEEEVEWIERELRLMETVLESVRATREGEQDKSAIEWAKDIEEVARRAEDLIAAYKKEFQKAAGTRFHLFRRRELGIELKELMTQIYRVSNKGKKIIIAGDIGKDGRSTTLGPERSSRTASSAMEQLNTLLNQKWLLNAREIEAVKSMREELTPLQDLLDEIQGLLLLEDQQYLCENQKVWVHEINGVFQFVNETFALNFTLKQGSGFRSLTLSSLHSVLQLDQRILKTRKLISEICRRYRTYEIGEFRSGRETWRVVVPKLISPDIYPTSVSAVFSIKETAEWLRVERELMKSFIKHAQGQVREDSDERKKVWFLQLKEIYNDLDAKAVYVKEILQEEGYQLNPLSLLRFHKRLEELENQIYYISERKMAYDVNSILQQPTNVVPQPPQPSPPLDILPAGDEEHTGARDQSRPWWLPFCMVYSIPVLWYPRISRNPSSVEVLIIAFRRLAKASARWRSLKRELDLMDALLNDIKKMVTLEARLKVWAEEVQDVVKEARHALGQGAAPPPLLHRSRWSFAQKLSGIMERIEQVHNWKMMYDITVQGSKGSGADIQSLDEREPYPSGLLSREIQSMKREMNLMLALINEVQAMNRVDAKVQVWVEEIQGLSLDVERLIDLYAANKVFISLVDAVNFPYPGWTARIDRLKQKIQRLHNRRLDYGIEHIARTPSFVEEIKARLLMNCQDLCIFPILGVNGNNTANMEELFRDDTIIRHFDVRVYIDMPQESNVLAILNNMANQIMKQLQPAERRNDQGSRVGDQEATSKLHDALRKEKWTGHEGIAQALQQLLFPRRYLIVFHDVQNVPGIWNDLQRAIPNSSNGSRIVITTCATVESTLGLLSPNQNSNLNDTAVQRNGGIEEISTFQLQAPIRLREIPAERRVLSEWEKVLEQLNNRRRSHLEAAYVNYDNIPGYLRQCLYYFLLFPKDFKIPARRLVALWVAEGIAKQKRGEEEPAEHVAESYLNELIDQNVVQVIKTKLNGKVKLCQLHDGTRKWLEKDAEANFFKDTSGGNRRLFDHLNQDDICHGHIHGNNPISSNSFQRLYGNVLSFLSFDTQEGQKPGEDIGCFLSKCISNRCFRSLRVLDLEKVFRPKLPMALRELSSLRYLGLRWTYLEELPSSISKLLNLLVLDLKHTYISTLPESIWKMQYLRHLYLSETYRSRFPRVPKRISLSELQTLWGAFIDEESPALEGLNTLKEVKKMGLTCRTMSSQELMNSKLEAVGEWILELKQLESLRLKSFDERGDPSYLYLKPLSMLTNLSTIYLLGKLKYPSVISEFPTNLIDLTLSGSELQLDPMPVLEKLRKLIILRFFSKSSRCKSMQCSSGGFPELRFLKLWLLEELEILEIEQGAMPNLEDLEIRSCTRLKMLPSQLQRMPTLKKLKLSPSEFTHQIKKSQRQLWSNLEHLVEDPFI